MRSTTVKALLEFLEGYAVETGRSAVKVVPGNRSGGVFWTMQGYDWLAPSNVELTDLLTFSTMLRNGKISLEGDWAFRFENAAKAECYLNNEPDSMFYAADLLQIGIDNKFVDRDTGAKTWAGKVYLSHAGGWTAWKHLK